MPITFQSLRSGSSGNCLLVQNGKTSLLIDAGFPSIRGSREALERVLPSVGAAVISHLHRDHVSYSALRVLEEHGVPVYVHRDAMESLAQRHFGGKPFDELDLRPFTERRFRVGDFAVRPFEVPHYPGHATFGFEVSCARRGRWRRLVVATDFHDGASLRHWFEDADFIYVEANHDPELLEEHWNPNSLYHLSNGHCGRLLRDAFDHSHAVPPVVMLGHLSEDRNRPELAAATVAGILEEAGYGAVELRVAPRSGPSRPIAIA